MKTPSLLPALQGFVVILLFIQLGNRLLPVSSNQSRSLPTAALDVVTGEPGCQLVEWSPAAAFTYRHRLYPPRCDQGHKVLRTHDTDNSLLFHYYQVVNTVLEE